MLQKDIINFINLDLAPHGAISSEKPTLNVATYLAAICSP